MSALRVSKRYPRADVGNKRIGLSVDPIVDLTTLHVSEEHRAADLVVSWYHAA